MENLICRPEVSTFPDIHVVANVDRQATDAGTGSMNLFLVRIPLLTRVFSFEIEPATLQILPEETSPPLPI